MVTFKRKWKPTVKWEVSKIREFTKKRSERIALKSQNSNLLLSGNAEKMSRKEEAKVTEVSEIREEKNRT